MQTESDAVQPCKLYFGELGTGGWVGRQQGEDRRRKEERERERKKERSKVRQPKQVRKGVQGRSVTTTMDRVMSSDV